jgi:anti-sigma B factor antagonist
MQTTLSFSQIVVIQPQGQINAANASEFKHQLQAAVTSPTPAIVLVDLERVESLDSAGLMILVSALTQAQHQNYQFSLCSLSPSIRMIFELTQLDRVFEIFPTKAAFEASIQTRQTHYATKTSTEYALA